MLFGLQSQCVGSGNDESSWFLGTTGMVHYNAKDGQFTTRRFEFAVQWRPKVVRFRMLFRAIGSVLGGTFKCVRHVNRSA